MFPSLFYFIYLCVRIQKMIQFNQLRISEDKTCLRAGCYIEGLAVYDNKYIAGIYIEHYSSHVSGNLTPSEHAICLYSNDEQDTSVKAKTVELKAEDIVEYEAEQNVVFGTHKLAGEMFYVWVDVEGPLTDYTTTTCDMDSEYYTGVVLDWEKVYSEGMHYARSMVDKCSNKCSDRGSFIDFILRWNTIRLAASVCDFDTLAEAWPMLFGNDGTITSSSSCGCFK